MSASVYSASFRLYLISRFAAGTAMTLLRTAIGWHVFALSHSALHLGLIGVAQFVPSFVLNLVGGVVADIYDRRKIMMLAQSTSLVGGAVLWLATSHEHVGLQLLYATVVLGAVANAFDFPARAALLPTLVAPGAFPRAVTAASTAQALAFVTGPALGGMVIAAAGIGSAYAVYVALILGSVVGLAVLELPSRRGTVSALSLRAVREGLQFVRRQPVILGCMLLDMLAVVFGGAAALLPLYAEDILRVGARGYGVLSASLEAGALLMSLALMVLPPIRRAGRALLLAVGVFGVATIVFGLSRSFPLSVCAYITVGMADQVSVVMRSTAIQLSTPDELRGRVSSVNFMFIAASNQLGAAESGLVAAITSAPFAVVSGGIVSLLVLVLIAITLPELRQYRTDITSPQAG